MEKETKITSVQIYNFLLELNKKAAKELIDIYFEDEKKQTFLRFPMLQNNKSIVLNAQKSKEKRISEQELRFVMVDLFKSYNPLTFSYAIEVPTFGNYSFKGTNSRSASIDLALYDDNNYQVLNIELKAHNADQKAINKDIEKLTMETPLGAWCHIFKNENKDTIKKDFGKNK